MKMIMPGGVTAIGLNSQDQQARRMLIVGPQSVFPMLVLDL